MKYVLKFFLFIYCMALTYGLNAQGHNPPQKIAAWYQFTGVSNDSVLVLPSVATPIYYRTRGAIYYSPADSNIYRWTGNQFLCVTCAVATVPGLPVQSVQFNSGPGTFRGSSHFTFDSVKFKLNVDSIATQQLYVNGVNPGIQYPTQMLANWGGYGGMIISNTSNCGSCATRITLHSPGGHELQLNQFHENFATAATVIASTSHSDFVIRADSGNMVYEMGPPGALIGELMRFWYPSGSMQVGRLLGVAPDSYRHHWQLYVAKTRTSDFNGALLTNSRIDIADEGAGFAVIGAYNYLADTLYVQGAGMEFTAYTYANPRVAIARIDTAGKMQTLGGICANCHYANPDILPSAVLQANSTTQGFLLPRMTDAQMKAIVSPANGLQVYNTDFNQKYWYNSTNAAWTLNPSNHDLYTPVAAGSTRILANDYSIFNAAVSTYTIQLPFNPKNNDFIEVKFTQGISTVSWTSGTILNAPATPVVGQYYKWVYDAGTSTWY